MANFGIKGADELADELIRMGEATGETARRMVTRGAAELVQGWVDKIKEHDHVDTNAMWKAVKPGKIKDDGGVLSVEVYPRGKDEKGVRNAEKAYILHYGWKKKEGTHFVDEVEEEGGAKAVEAMTEIFNQYIDGGGK